MSIFRPLKIAAALAAVSAIAAIPASAQDYRQNPNYGTVNLRTGFTPDPRVVSVRAGGNIDASRINGCRGLISNAPDVRLNYQAGSLPLIISVASSADTTLVINGPDGRWYCDDDGGENGLNPSVRFNGARSGQYDIWIGTYSSGNGFPPAQLNISELYSQ